MIAVEENASLRRIISGTFSIPLDCCILLKTLQNNREDAWDFCGVAERFGGVEVSDGCFTFDTEQRRLFAIETLKTQFGSTYFEAVARHNAMPQLKDA
jgi:hypothetical protein